MYLAPKRAAAILLVLIIGAVMVIMIKTVFAILLLCFNYHELLDRHYILNKRKAYK